MARDGEKSPFQRVSLIADNVPYGFPQRNPGTAIRMPPNAVLPRPTSSPLLDQFGPDSGDIGGAVDVSLLESPRGDVDQERKQTDAQSGIVEVRDPYHYAKIVELTAVAPDNSLGQQSVKFLDAPPGRRNYLAFRNSSAAANIFIGFGTTASLNSLIRLIPGQILILDTVIPQDDLYLLADAAAGTLIYQFSNIL